MHLTFMIFSELANKTDKLRVTAMYVASEHLAFPENFVKVRSA